MMFLLAVDVPPVEVPTWFWEAFIGVVVVLLVLDLTVLHRKPHEIKTHEALASSAFWVVLAAAFGAWVWWEYGRLAGEQFFTCYVVEKSLSVDNLFVFLVIFQYFKVPPELQHRVLFFGVLGAIVTRLVFILAGIALLEHFAWLAWVLGAFLVYTAVKLLLKRGEAEDPSKSRVVRAVQRVVPFVPEYHGLQMTVRKGSRRVGTMLLLVVLVVETTDIVFAVDSVPAVIGITRDRFIVFTSNICAILGLRAVYFLLAKFMGAFRYLQTGLAVVLAFVGVKTFKLFEIDSGTSLVIIGGVLAAAVAASILHPEKAASTAPTE